MEVEVEKGKWYLIVDDKEYTYSKERPVYAQCVEVFNNSAWFKIQGITGKKVVRDRVLKEVEDPRLFSKIKNWWFNDEEDEGEYRGG